jgi:hypothetical protein
MGWSVSYQVVRDRPLTDDELLAVARFLQNCETHPWSGEGVRLAATRTARPDSLVAVGSSKLTAGGDDGSADAERMAKALRDLARTLPDAELRVADDLGVFGWKAGARRCALDGRPGRPLVPCDDAEFTPVEELAPLPPPVLPGKLGQALAAIRDGQPAAAFASDDALLGQTLAAWSRIAKHRATMRAARALLAAAPPTRLARVGLARYGSIANQWDARELVNAALDAGEDVGPLVPAFREMWRKPKGICFYGDVVGALPEMASARLGAAEGVVAELEADLALAEELAEGTSEGTEEPLRRAEAAVGLLVRGGTARGLACLVGLVRRTRNRATCREFDDRVRRAIHFELAQRGDCRALPTLLHDLGTMRTAGGVHGDELVALARLDPRRARPLVHELDERGGLPWDVIAALRLLGEPEDQARLAAVARRHPRAEVRARALDALAELGRPPVPPDPPAPPETLVTHPDTEVRAAALCALFERRDPSLYVSLLAGELLHQVLSSWTEGLQYSALSDWSPWDDLVPRELRRRPHAEQLRWADGPRPTGLVPQVVLPALAPVIERGVHAAARELPLPLLRLPQRELDALLEEEAAVLAALAAEAR